MPVYNKRGILLLPKVIVLNPKDGAVVQPVETTASAENATQEVGPAFATKAPADEIGPGV